MKAFEISQIIEAQKQSGKLYLEFLRVPLLSVGVYVLPADSIDPQQPHNEDEVYYVISGTGSIQVGDEDRNIGPGSIIYVDAHREHRFHTITEDLELLVFFAPPESS